MIRVDTRQQTSVSRRGERSRRRRRPAARLPGERDSKDCVNSDCRKSEAEMPSKKPLAAGGLRCAPPSRPRPATPATPRGGCRKSSSAAGPGVPRDACTSGWAFLDAIEPCGHPRRHRREEDPRVQPPAAGWHLQRVQHAEDADDADDGVVNAILGGVKDAGRAAPTRPGDREPVRRRHRRLPEPGEASTVGPGLYEGGKGPPSRGYRACRATARRACARRASRRCRAPTRRPPSAASGEPAALPPPPSPSSLTPRPSSSSLSPLTRSWWPSSRRSSARTTRSGRPEAVKKGTKNPSLTFNVRGRCR